jgi:NACHT domain
MPSIRLNLGRIGGGPDWPLSAIKKRGVLEEVMLALAAAIVKTAFKIWTKDSELACNTTDELTDFIKDKIVGSSGKRKARRWVEDLEEIVNTRLMLYMEHEFAGLQDNERQATVLAVADTLAKAKLTDQTLLDQDLDPLHLERFLRGAVPDADRDLGYQARGLYALLLPESCAYVVSLATSLPEFQVGAFTELLRRDTAIISRLDEILKLLPPQQARVLDMESTTDEAYRNFATAYRRQVVTRLDRLRLFGVDVFTQQYPLTLAYISLSVFSYHYHRRRGNPQLIRDAGGPELPIEEVLSKTKRLFVTGPAGSGKTTIIQWLAVRAAREDFPGALLAWNDYEPFFIPLRRYTDRGLPVPAEFTEAMGRHIADEVPSGWVERQLATGSALILIDGIDELPSDRHDAVRQWVHSLADDYPECAYVITSRPGAVSEDWLATSDFASATLAPMSHVTVQTFVRQWIESMRSESVDREERDLLTSYEQPMVDALLSARHVRELAATPLLCALLCALYYARSGQLPSDRMGVYAAAFDMLERRDNARGIKSDVQIGYAESRLILEDLAYWLIRNGLSDAEVGRIIQQISSSKKYLHKVTASADAIYRQLLVRSGLLQEPAVDRVSFIHRTFQEYLAASAAINGDNVEEIASHALDARWTQVVIMAAGHATPAQRERLFNALLKKARREQQEAVPIALVILACLETSPSISSDLLKKIGKAASAVLPPHDRGDVEALVKAGEFALEILGNVKIKTLDEAARVLEVIRRVKSEESLPLMESVLRQVPEAADMISFLAVWQTFRPQDVVDVISRISSIKGVFIELPRCQDIIPCLTAIKNFNCVYRGAVADLTNFKTLHGIENLTIHSTGVVDLTPLTSVGVSSVNVVLAHYEAGTPESDFLLGKYVAGVDELRKTGTSVTAAVETDSFL